VALLQAINDQRATLIVYALKATVAVAHVDVAVAGGRASLISGLLIDFYAPARRQQQQQQQQQQQGGTYFKHKLQSNNHKSFLRLSKHLSKTICVCMADGGQMSIACAISKCCCCCCCLCCRLQVASGCCHRC